MLLRLNTIGAEVIEGLAPSFNYLPETEFNENEWGASLSVARFLLDIGLETLKEFEKGKSILTRTQSWLVAIIQKGKLNR